jgi:hypothetical protein
MQELSRSGEPEIAVIGAVTAIEWFLHTLVDHNASLPKWYKTDRRPSINRCLELPLKFAPSEELRSRLRAAADRRNEMTHESSPRSKCPSDVPEICTEVIRTGFALYKEVQVELRVGLLG